MSHRRARKQAKKQAAADALNVVIANVDTRMRGLGWGVRTFRTMQIGKHTMKKRMGIKRGPSFTKPHPIQTKQARRAANKRARASAARNR